MSQEPKEKKALTALGRRIDEAAKREGLGDNEIIRRIGAKQGWLSKVKTGERGTRVDVEYVFNLARELKEEAEWLWLGRGARKKLLAVEDAATTARETHGMRADAIDLVAGDPKNAALTRMEALDLMWKESKRLNEDEARAQRLREKDIEDTQEVFKEKRKADRAAKAEAKKKSVPERTPRSKRDTGTQ